MRSTSLLNPTQGGGQLTPPGWGSDIDRMHADLSGAKIKYRVERAGCCLPAILFDMCGCSDPKHRSYLWITESAVEARLTPRPATTPHPNSSLGCLSTASVLELTPKSTRCPRPHPRAGKLGD